MFLLCSQSSIASCFNDRTLILKSIAIWSLNCLPSPVPVALTALLNADHLDQLGSELGYAVDSCDDALARRFGIE